MDKILIVMPVINLWDAYTIHAMESIAASVCDVPFEVLIVNQASTDETVNKATDFGNRKMPGRVHVITNEKNTGCAGGWNAGVKFAIDNGFSHIGIFNNDILVGPNAILEMYKRLCRDPKVLMTSAVDTIRELAIPQLVLKGDHEVNNKPDTEAPHPNFSCFMITRETVEKVGMFDEGFFPAYFEDNDYHYRLKLSGGTDCAIANTRAVFIHYGSRTQNQNLGEPMVPGPAFEKNRQYFISKWGGAPSGEKFTQPFNDPAKDLTYVKQS